MDGSVATDPGSFLTHKLAISVLLLILGLSAPRLRGVCPDRGVDWSCVNTNRLADKTWSNLLLWIRSVGTLTRPIVFGLVWSAPMLAYVICAPAGTVVQPLRQPEISSPAEPPKTPLPAH